MLTKTPARTHRRIRGGRGPGELGPLENTPAAPEIVPVLHTRNFLSGLGVAHSRRIGISRIIDLFQNVSREAGSPSVRYGVGFPPPRWRRFCQSDIRWSLSAPMSAFGGKADVLADLSACLLIAISGRSSVLSV